MDELDIEKYRYTPDFEITNTSEIATLPERKRSAFIKGPIPMDWLARAAAIPRCNALKVGLTLFHLAGIQKKLDGIVLCPARCDALGLGRKAVYRGVTDLEREGLVRVHRKNGQCPRIDLLDAEI